MIRQHELIEKIKTYDPDVDEKLINRAFVFAKEAHGSQMRASGDPYIIHPLEVAILLTKLKLDAASIMTALLHDTVEDTHASLQDIEKNFGKEVAKLVDGVTKLNRLELQSHHTSQAENFRKLVLAMSEDIRVLLVKLADRVHNMQTLHFINKPDKRLRIAKETIEIYAPLAERISITEFKDILEDLSFREINPEARSSILKRLQYLRKEGHNIVENTCNALRDILQENEISAQVLGREKTPYSIWKKMQRQNISFETLTDIVAFRVIVDSVPQCYQVLGIIHSLYRVIPNRFKDYISMPKPNGYQSLHTSIIGPENQRVEIQIRTRSMDEIAVMGVAAHWQYKQGANTEGKQYKWMRELLDILEQAGGAEEFLEHTKLEMFQDQVFCFSPRGEVYALPLHSTCVDFAYAVHSEVGDHCVGAKVNGKLVPLRTELKNGDQVEIMTSKSQSPSPEWERFVQTGKAKARIRRFIRIEQKNEYLALGKEILQKIFRHEGKPFSEKTLEPVISDYKCTHVEDLMANIGSGLVSANEVLRKIHPELSEPDKKTSLEEDEGQFQVKKSEKNKAITIKGLVPGMAMRLAKCCHPLPGDRIVGIITTGKGVTIHTIDCDTLQNFQDVPERWLDLSWENPEEQKASFVGRLFLTLSHEQGVLSIVSTIIAKHKGNISNLKITHRANDFFELLVDIEVTSLSHLHEIIAALRTCSIVNSVERAKN